MKCKVSEQIRGLIKRYEVNNNWVALLQAILEEFKYQ